MTQKIEMQFSNKTELESHPYKQMSVLQEFRNKYIM